MKAKTIKKEEPGSINSIIAVMAVVVVVVALFNLVMTFSKVSEFNKQMTGYATSSGTGYVNITVNTALAVDITPGVIYWGAGKINVSGSVYANLTTYGNATRVENGDWVNATVTGLIIKNIGNVNASLNLTMIKNVTEFFGSLSNPVKKYRINISEKEVGSCNSTANLPFNSWLNANKSTWRVCHNFGADGSYNELWLDVQLTIPYDTNTTATVLTETYTATLENPIVS
jgi:hypothetical protein